MNDTIQDPCLRYHLAPQPIEGRVHDVGGHVAARVDVAHQDGAGLHRAQHVSTDVRCAESEMSCTLGYFEIYISEI